MEKLSKFKEQNQLRSDELSKIIGGCDDQDVETTWQGPNGQSGTDTSDSTTDLGDDSIIEWGTRKDK